MSDSSITKAANAISSIPFDGKDFMLWKIKFLAYMAGQGWDKALQPTPDASVSLTAGAMGTMSINDAADALVKEIKTIGEIKPKVYALLVNSLHNNVLALLLRLPPVTHMFCGVHCSNTMSETQWQASMLHVL